MESLFLLIPVALIFVAIAVKVFFWAVNSGQYDDLETEAHRILFDDDQPVATSQDKTPSGKAQPGDASTSQEPSGQSQSEKSKSEASPGAGKDGQ